MKESETIIITAKEWEKRQSTFLEWANSVNWYGFVMPLPYDMPFEIIQYVTPQGNKVVMKIMRSKEKSETK